MHKINNKKFSLILKHFLVLYLFVIFLKVRFKEKI